MCIYIFLAVCVLPRPVQSIQSVGQGGPTLVRDVTAKSSSDQAFSTQWCCYRVTVQQTVGKWSDL
jgi:hypothetical protein